MKNILFLSLTLMLLSSCFAVHHGYLQSSAQLSSANYTMVKRSVQGKATTTIVLGIGGLSKEALVAEAKENLMREHKVTDKQLLANVSVDWKVVTTPIYFVVWQRTCVVTADIIEFTK